MTDSENKNSLQLLKKDYLSDALLRVQAKNDHLLFTGVVALSEKHIKKIEVALVGRRTQATFLYPVSFEHPADENESAEKQYHWTWSLNTFQLAKKLLIENTGNETFSVRLMIHGGEDSAPLVFSVSFPETYTAELFKETAVNYGRTTALMTTRVSEEGYLELRTAFLDRDVYQKAAFHPFSIVMKARKKEKPIWVIGNRPDSLGENSWLFFEYALAHSSEAEIYYVLDAAAPEWKMADKKAGSHLLAYHSKEYFEKVQEADLVISEAAPGHLFPSFSPFWDRRIRARRIILPSYPLGLTNEKWTLNKHFVPWKIDGLAVSSKTEKRFVHETLGYSEEEVFLTGLPSHELLLEQEQGEPEEEKLLLLAPHLRQTKWHSLKEAQPNPLLSLLTQAVFQQWIAENNFRLLVLLTEEHPALKEAFAEMDVKTKTVDAFEKEYWLAKANILLTDDHPVSLAFSALERPVLYYQPEQEDHFAKIGHSPSERNYQNELPGETAANAEQLVYLFEQLKERDFIPSRRNLKKARTLFEFPPQGASERFFEKLRGEQKDSR